MKQITLLFLAFFSLFAFTFSQTPQNIEQELVKRYAKVIDNSAYKSDSDLDLLSKANEEFKAKMLSSSKITATLEHNFSELSKHINISTSEDGRIRVYSWDALDGGTMHFFETVYQFRGEDGKVYSQSVPTEEGNAGGFVKNIFSVTGKQGNIYLVVSSAIGSTRDRYESVGLFQIKKDKLNDNIKFFKTSSGLTNSISFEYNFFSVFERKERPIQLILFDNKTKTLKIPIVIENDNFPDGEVTDEFISYKFNGTYFVKVN